MGFIQNIDFSILDFIQQHFRCAFLDWFMPLVTKLGDGGIFWICVAVLMLIFPKTRKTGIMMGVALIMGVLVGNLMLKPLVARVRPYDVRGIIDLLVPVLSDFSFPSGHTLASFEAAVVLLIRDKRMGIPAIIIAVIVAISRLYLFVHYPTDVLAGAVLGTVFAILAVHIVNKVHSKILSRRSAEE